jgi:hypothetical protein
MPNNRGYQCTGEGASAAGELHANASTTQANCLNVNVNESSNGAADGAGSWDLTDNTATALTARNMNQAVGDVGATYSVTLEANDALFSSRIAASHRTANAYCHRVDDETNYLFGCTTQPTCEANHACNNQVAGTWVPVALGNTRAEFDPFKVHTGANAGR